MSEYFVSFHVQTKGGTGFGDASVVEMERAIEKSDDIEVLRKAIKLEMDEKHTGIDTIVILNIVPLPIGC